MDIIQKLESRMRSHAFVQFKCELAAELIKSGFNILTAINLADAETRGRARVSFDVGIPQALNATVVVLRDSQGNRRFCLTSAEVQKAA